MARYLELCADREEELCCAARALSSPVRLRILRLLSSRTLNVKEIAAELGLPASSTAVNVRLLEEAGLIETCQQPGEHGAMKLCSRSCDLVTVRLTGEPMPESSVYTVHMPVGNFTDCEVVPTCGLGTETGKIGQPDRKESFYLPERTGAQILWSSGGYVEYRFPNPVPAGEKIAKISFSMELCSEAPGSRENWPSDITLWINGQDCGVWTSPGDFGNRRGRLTPAWVSDWNSQYGLLTTWTVTEEGCFVNGQRTGATSLKLLGLDENRVIVMRVGNSPEAVHLGGFNLFGRKSGDFEQDIIMTVEC